MVMILAPVVPPSLFQSLMYETEIVMYTDIMPKLKRLEPRLNTPATYYASLEEGVMMMENLKKMGYDIIGTQRGVRGSTYTSQNVQATTGEVLQALCLLSVQVWRGRSTS